MPIQKRIAVLAFESRPFHTFPSLINTITQLLKKDYQIDVYIPESMKTSVSFKNISIIYCGSYIPYEYIKETLKKINKNKQYDLIISYYFEGLVIANILNKSHYIPTIYFSHELIYTNYGKNKLKRFFTTPSLLYLIGKYVFLFLVKIFFFKITSRLPLQNIKRKFIDAGNNAEALLVLSYNWWDLQNYGSRFIKFSIVQDKKRKEFLKREFKFVNKVYCLPNSYIGYYSNKNDFAYKKFSIPINKKIILFSGGLEQSFDSDLIDLATKLPDEYVLFLQGFSRDGYVKTLKKKSSSLISQGKIYITDKEYNDKEYEQLVQSSYLGLVWYCKPSPQDINMYYLGLSSGKLCRYLACGRPVITPDYFYGYKKLIEGSNIGKVCSDSSQILDKIIIISKNYSNIQASIKKYYLPQLEYSTQFKPILKAINNLFIYD